MCFECPYNSQHLACSAHHPMPQAIREWSWSGASWPHLPAHTKPLQSHLMFCGQFPTPL